MDRLHEGDYHTQHKPTVKEPKDWPRSEHCHEQPALPSPPKSDSLSEPRMLNGHPCTLKHEIGCRKPIASASGQRKNQVVDQPGENENQETSHIQAHLPTQGAKDQFVGMLTEAEIPPLSPKLGKGHRTQRGRHDGCGLDTNALPDESDDLKSAKV